MGILNYALIVVNLLALATIIILINSLRVWLKRIHLELASKSSDKH